MSDTDPRPDARRRRTAAVVLGVAAAVVALLVAVSVTRGNTGATARPTPAPPTHAPSASATPPSPASAGPSARPPASDPATSTARGIGIDLSRRDRGDPLALGRVDAPVVLVEWADFRCPFCGEFARQTKPKLMPYVENGTLRIEFRNYPIFGEQSIVAAHAAEAAGEQGRFWQFYDAVYADSPARGHADLPKAKLIAYARQASVPNLKKFEADLTNRVLTAKVSDDLNEAIAIGISSTPTFVVNDIPVVGAQPTEVFTKEIERQAREAKSGH